MKLKGGVEEISLCFVLCNKLNENEESEMSVNICQQLSQYVGTEIKYQSKIMQH